MTVLGDGPSVSSDVPTIRHYRPDDAPACTRVLRDAFWDVYRPGCIEHLIWHRAVSSHPDLLADQVLVAQSAGALVGCIMSTRAEIVSPSGVRTPVVAVGPLGVMRAWQRQGVGGRLLTASLARARSAGERAAFLYGDPAYYPRFGFADARRWAVTTADGASFPDFMGLELAPEGLAGIAGRLVESSLFEVTPADVDAFVARCRNPAFPRRLHVAGVVG